MFNEHGQEELYRKAIDRWGYQAQYNMAAEELAELIAALNKYDRGRVSLVELIDEIADARIMIQQIICMLDINPAEVEAQINVKLSRLKDRIERA